LSSQTPVAGSQLSIEISAHQHAVNEGAIPLQSPPRDGAGDFESLGIGIGQMTTGTEAEDNWRGAGRITHALYAMSDGSIHYLAVVTETATIDGCGSGAITYAFSGVLSPQDEAGRSENTADWRIIAGSGKDELEGLIGGGALVGTVHWEGGQPTVHDGSFSGSLSR
jgi:hypothetical protein